MANECYTGLLRELTAMGVNKERRKALTDTIDRLVANKEAIKEPLKDRIVKEVQAEVRTAELGKTHMKEVNQNLINKQDSEKMLQALQEDPLAYLRSLVDGTTFSGTKAGEVTLDGVSNHYFAKFKSQLRKDLGKYEEIFDSLPEAKLVQVYDVMNQLKQKGGDVNKYSADIVQIGKAMNNLFDTQRKSLQELGVRIGDQSENWFGLQTHRQDVVAKSKPEEWGGFLKERIDIDKTLANKGLGPEDLDEYLLTTHQKIVAGDRQEMNGSRSIVFKDAQSKLEYDQKYGFNDLRDMTTYSIDRNSKIAGLHFLMGNDPKATWERAVQTTEELTSDKFKKSFRNLDEFEAIKRVLFGDPTATALTDFESWFSQATSWMLKFQRLTKLQQALASTIPDIANTASMWKAYFTEGGSIFGGLSAFKTNMGALAKMTKEESQELVDMIGLALSDNLTRFDPITGPDVKVKDKALQSVSKGMDKITKFNGLLWQEGVAKKISAFAMNNSLFQTRGKGFDALNPRTKNLLQSHGINSREWDLIRKFGTQEIQGRGYMAQGNLLNIPKDNPILKELASDLGIKPEAVINSMQVKMSTMTNNFASRSVPSGGTSSKLKIQTFLGNPNQNSVRSNVTALVMQFKSYPLSAVETIKRVALSNPEMDATRFRDLLRKENRKHLLFLVDYAMTGATLAGASMIAKDVANGKTPRNIDGAFMAEAMSMAIAPISFGYMMDVFQGEFKSSALLGPSARNVDDMARLTHAYLSGDEHALAKTMNTLWHNLPLTKTFFLRPLMDEIVRESMIQATDPAYFRRLQGAQERRMEENGQEWLFR